MKIEEQHYKEWHDDFVQMKKEIEDENAAMTDAEKEAEKELRKIEFEAIRAKAEAKESRTWHFQRPWVKLLFKRLSKIALSYARADEVDIIVETSDKHGMIRLEFDLLVLDDQRPTYWKAWRKLIRYADTFWINNVEKYGNSVVQCTFFYDFVFDWEWKSIPGLRG